MRPLAVFVERFDGPNALALREIEPREPGEGEVAIETHAAGVNFPELLISYGKYQDLQPLPFVIGKEGAGIVRKVGRGVTSLAIGDRVAFHLEAGSFAEHVVVPEVFCFPLPSGVPFRDAAGMVLTYQTAHYALTARAQMKAGDWVLVTGASGGVGIAAVELAKAFGGRVIAGISGNAKRAFVEARKPDGIVDLAAPDLVNALRKQISEIAGGQGVDVVIDNMGGVASDAALRAMAPGGRLGIVGFTSGTIPSVKANYILVKGLSVIGVYWNHLRETTKDPSNAWRIRDIQRDVFALLAEGKITSPVTATYPMTDVAKALTDFEQRRTMGKIVLTTRHFVAD